jgi:hypothetical protein
MRHLLLTACLVAVPRLALACPVCFGQSDAPMAKAMNLGIWAMLGIVVAVLCGFATFIIHLIRRERLVAEQSARSAGPLVLPGGDPREGTAQC